MQLHMGLSTLLFFIFFFFLFLSSGRCLFLKIFIYFLFFLIYRASFPTRPSSSLFFFFDLLGRLPTHPVLIFFFFFIYLLLLFFFFRCDFFSRHDFYFLINLGYWFFGLFIPFLVSIEHHFLIRVCVYPFFGFN